MPTPLNVTLSQNNSAESTASVSYPAHNDGDRVDLLVMADGANPQSITPPATGPNGETIVEIRHGRSALNMPQVGGWYFISDGGAVAGSLSFAIETSASWGAISFRFATGDFNVADPDGGRSAVGGATSSSTSPTEAFTADAEAGDGDGGLVTAFIATDFVDISQTETGWTHLGGGDFGPNARRAFTRDAAATGSESIGSTEFDLAATEDSSNFVYIVNAAPATATTRRLINGGLINNGLINGGLI